MRASQFTAIGLVVAAGLWIASGHFFPHERAEGAGVASKAPDKLFRVAVQTARPQPYTRRITLSGRTEADKKVIAVARTGGLLTELNVQRGSRVEKGDVIAVLSDEAREAQVMQARAQVEQRRVELEARQRLAKVNAVPRLELAAMEAQYKAAVANLAAAEAERNRGEVRAPWSGIVTDVTSEIGSAAFSMAGKEIAQIVSLDPMLAVAEISEQHVGGVEPGGQAEVRLVNGLKRTGRVRFVSRVASETTRTYRIEVELENADGSVPDGITAEVTIPMTSQPATRVPRSALVFSSRGDLGVRTADSAGVIGFAPVTVVEDRQDQMWVAGLEAGTRIVVQGQDFVREGQRVEAVPTPTAVGAVN